MTTQGPLRWYESLKRAILSLEGRPLRCPVIPEDKRLRQLLYGRKPLKYRVIFQITQQVKNGSHPHIRHGAWNEHQPDCVAGAPA